MDAIGIVAADPSAFVPNTKVTDSGTNSHRTGKSFARTVRFKAGLPGIILMLRGS
jgi:hypothetical protein